MNKILLRSLSKMNKPIVLNKCVSVGKFSEKQIHKRPALLFGSLYVSTIMHFSSINVNNISHLHAHSEPHFDLAKQWKQKKKVLNQYFYQLSSTFQKLKMVAPPIDPKLIEKNSIVRAAIPILPMPLATLCFFLNLLIPGLGKYFSFNHTYLFQIINRGRSQNTFTIRGR